MPASVGSGMSGNPTVYVTQSPAPYVHAYTPSANLMGEVTRALFFRRLLRQTGKKKERSEMKGNAGACGEGSPKCEWMRSERRTVRDARRHVASSCAKNVAGNSHAACFDALKLSFSRNSKMRETAKTWPTARGI